MTPTEHGGGFGPGVGVDPYPDPDASVIESDAPEAPSIDDLIAASSIGAGLRDIEERGINAHLAGFEQEMATAEKKRKKATPTTARTLAECRRRGWIAGVVERRIPFPKPRGTKIDLFGVIDVVAIIPATGEIECSKRDAAGTICSSTEHADCCLQFETEHRVLRKRGETVGIQSTANSSGHHADHRAKILAEPRARAWVEAGNRLELWSWSKQGARGKAKRWTLRVETFTVESWRSA